jgi:hypothetical protein
MRRIPPSTSAWIGHSSTFQSSLLHFAWPAAAWTHRTAGPPGEVGGHAAADGFVSVRDAADQGAAMAPRRAVPRHWADVDLQTGGFGYETRKPSGSTKSRSTLPSRPP